ncbi:MAG: hypothetical protein F4Z69_04525 [Bacteroidetes bacterium SB0668_bin_1]|nr:hypothetical protein [Bacteroidetes bacterium SB0668_bin_1]
MENHPKGITPKVLRVAVPALLIILASGLIASGLSNLTKRSQETNLISLSIRQAEHIEAGFETAEPDEVENYVRESLRRRIDVPAIEGAELTGVSIHDAGDGARIPVLLYRNTNESGDIVLYAYSYAFLDTHGHRFQLTGDVLERIETEDLFDLRDSGETNVLVWRQRDDIFIAVTESDIEALENRIRASSQPAP